MDRKKHFPRTLNLTFITFVFFIAALGLILSGCPSTQGPPEKEGATLQVEEEAGPEKVSKPSCETEALQAHPMCQWVLKGISGELDLKKFITFKGYLENSYYPSGKVMDSRLFPSETVKNPILEVHYNYLPDIRLADTYMKADTNHDNSLDTESGNNIKYLTDGRIQEENGFRRPLNIPGADEIKTLKSYIYYPPNPGHPNTLANYLEQFVSASHPHLLLSEMIYLNPKNNPEKIRKLLILGNPDGTNFHHEALEIFTLDFMGMNLPQSGTFKKYYCPNQTPVAPPLPPECLNSIIAPDPTGLTPHASIQMNLGYDAQGRLSQFTLQFDGDVSVNSATVDGKFDTITDCEVRYDPHSPLHVLASYPEDWKRMSIKETDKIDQITCQEKSGGPIQTLNFQWAFLWQVSPGGQEPSL